MRSSKSILAGVAAGALALGALTIASAPAASAKPSIKPKAIASATASAVRATGTGSGALNIPPAKLGWKGTGSLSSSTIDLTTAPTGSAVMTVWDSAGTAVDDTVTLSTNGTSVSNAYAIGDDTGIYINVDTAGLYAGVLFNGSDTVSFSFTTAGAPVSIALTPATQTVLVGGVGSVNVALKDASGATTQPQVVDSITMSSSGDDTIAFTSLTSGVGGKLQFGSFDDTIQTQTAGTSTITATPLGTLPASGVTTATATLIKSGSVSNTKVANMTVSVPTNALNAVASGPWSAEIPAGTTTVTVVIDDTTTAPAGNQLRFAAALSGLGGGTGFLNGAAYTAPIVTNVTTDAAKKATLTYTLGAQALVAPAALTIQQINVANVAVSGSSITATQTTPGALVATVPTGPVVAKVGASSTIAVQVDDSFGTPLSGWAVELVRTSPSSAVLAATTTNAAGVASVTATPLSTTTNNQAETYVVQSRPATGGTWNLSAPITITYTTSGNINTLTVGQAASTPSSFSNTAPTITTAPQVRIASGGNSLTGLVLGAGANSTTNTFTVATGAEAAVGVVSSYATFTPDTNPGNPINVTVPAGVKVSSTAPGATTLYSGGAQSVIVADNAPVYVWATKTGVHDITFTSGGVTVTGKIKAINTNADAFNLSVDKAEQTLAPSGIGRTDVSVKDMFGNAVASASTTLANGVATGEVLFGGFSNTAAVSTGTTGTASIVIIAGPTGSGTLSFTFASGITAATGTTYTAPAGIAAPSLSAAQLIRIGAVPADKSITITGSRTTVSGKSGIKVDGVTAGIEDGKTVTPFIRFPGETTFTAGSARPAITNGEVTWQRKTGKRVTVYLELSDDAAIKSNRVTIQAN